MGAYFFMYRRVIKKSSTAADPLFEGLLSKGDMATLYYACYLEMLAFIGMNVGKVKGTSFFGSSGAQSLPHSCRETATSDVVQSRSIRGMMRGFIPG